MEKETVPATAPAIPTSIVSKRISTTLSEGGTTTAVAVKATPKTTVDVETTVEQSLANAGWTTWIAMGLATLGTLAMGTFLPFWLVDLALQAARMMLILGK